MVGWLEWIRMNGLVGAWDVSKTDKFASNTLWKWNWEQKGDKFYFQILIEGTKLFQSDFLKIFENISFNISEVW